jgi:hypothetical protein
MDQQAIVNAFHAAATAPVLERDALADAIPAQGDRSGFLTVGPELLR